MTVQCLKKRRQNLLGGALREDGITGPADFILGPNDCAKMTS